jgi:primase-polymerase (primpol)-like protein
MFPEDEQVKPPPKAPEDRGEAIGNEELIKLALQSKNGKRFRRHHFEGDSTGYSSRSEADFAHLADLCFWTGGDKERMVRLFSISALYLPEKGMRYVHRSAKRQSFITTAATTCPRRRRHPKKFWNESRS